MCERVKKKTKDEKDTSDNLDNELDQIKEWGPKFSKISNIYGLKNDEEN